MNDPCRLRAPCVLCLAPLLLAACGAKAGLGELDLPVDGGPADAGRRFVDAGGLDAGGLDAGGLDAGGLDAGGLDAGSPDAGIESDIGDPCGGPLDCMSAHEVVDVPACIHGFEWPNGHLWEDGYCTAQCTPTSTPGDGEPLARDDCPQDALCAPAGDSIGICLLACETDVQCRMPGAFIYYCRREFGSDDPLPVGVCMSAHCQSRGCPGSARCDC